jgi:hypothetical protein
VVTSVEEPREWALCEDSSEEKEWPNQTQNVYGKEKIEESRGKTGKEKCIQGRMIYLSRNKTDSFIVGKVAPPHTHTSSTLCPRSQPYPTLTNPPTSPITTFFNPFFVAHNYQP